MNVELLLSLDWFYKVQAKLDSVLIFCSSMWYGYFIIVEKKIYENYVTANNLLLNVDLTAKMGLNGIFMLLRD